MMPEYVGYNDVGISDGLFASRRSAIEEHGDLFFKYRLDFDHLRINASVAAVCVSRPTNPTGNVLTDDEIGRLDGLCRQHSVPLIVDAAYGTPFPGIVFVDAESVWNDNVIYCMSLSKLGLPAARTGIVIASHEIIEALTRMIAVLNLAVGSVGAVMVRPWIESGEILDISRNEIMPFYKNKAMRACEWLEQELAGVPFRIHEPEGALFLWLWLPGLPITNAELYVRLKEAGVFVLSGEHFFPGLDEEWQHRHECLRLSYAQDDETVRAGIELIGRELRQLYDV
jgi:valine--pyruvate aminotransferase